MKLENKDRADKEWEWAKKWCYDKKWDASQYATWYMGRWTGTNNQSCSDIAAVLADTYFKEHLTTPQHE